MGQAQPKNKKIGRAGRARPAMISGRARPKNFYRLGQHRAGLASYGPVGGRIIFLPPHLLHVTCRRQNRPNEKKNNAGGGKKCAPGVEAIAGGAVVSPRCRGLEDGGAVTVPKRRRKKDFSSSSPLLFVFGISLFSSLSLCFLFSLFCFRFIPFLLFSLVRPLSLLSASLYL